MTLDSAMADIESLESALTLGLASDLKTYLRIAGKMPAVMFLSQGLADRAHQLAVIKRVAALAQVASDPRYAHPSDDAIAVYLWLLASRDRSLAEVGAGLALQLSNGRWAPRVARALLAPRPEATGALLTSLSETSQDRPRILIASGATVSPSVAAFYTSPLPVGRLSPGKVTSDDQPPDTWVLSQPDILLRPILGAPTIDTGESQ